MIEVISPAGFETSRCATRPISPPFFRTGPTSSTTSGPLKKETRIRVLTERYEEYQTLIEGLYEHARRETETIRRVDPEAGQVPIDLDKFRSLDIQQRKILRDIADELGQLMSRSQPDTSATKSHLYHSVEGVDMQRVLGLTTSADTETALNHAAAEQWVAPRGDQIVRGATSPNPMAALPDEHNSRGWASSRSW